MTTEPLACTLCDEPIAATADGLCPTCATADVESPCIGVCTLDDVTNECMGCARTMEEIMSWLVVGPDERRAVMVRIKGRS